MNEIYKQFRNTKYEVSNLGNVRNKAGEILRPQVAGSGGRYLQARIFTPGNAKGTLYYIHRMVAETFIGTIPAKFTVHHKDYNTYNNAVENLDIISLKDNIIDYLTCTDCHANYKLTPAIVKEIRENKKIPARVWAEKYKVNIHSIYRARNKTTWSFV